MTSNLTQAASLDFMNIVLFVLSLHVCPHLDVWRCMHVDRTALRTSIQAGRSHLWCRWSFLPISWIVVIFACGGLKSFLHLKISHRTFQDGQEIPFGSLWFFGILHLHVDFCGGCMSNVPTIGLNANEQTTIDKKSLSLDNLTDTCHLWINLSREGG